MAAYLIALLNVTDADLFGQYASGTPAVVAAYGGRYLARGGLSELFEGDVPIERVVIVEFETLDQARTYYNSPEYTELRSLRAGAATGALLITPGLA
jgi:uncharacterized protein (DUF1330 family)